jgi:hypothetical protein
MTRALPEDRPHALTPEFSAALRRHLDSLAPGDYFALLAYIPMTAEHEAALQRIRETVLLKKGVATCLGFGPRFLHSTGQAYKGGPNTGVFVQITCEDGIDLPVPGQKYSFGVVKAAQARGDFAVLEERAAGRCECICRRMWRRGWGGWRWRWRKHLLGDAVPVRTRARTRSGNAFLAANSKQRGRRRACPRMKWYAGCRPGARRSIACWTPRTIW